MASVIMASVIMPSVIMANVIMANVIMASVTEPYSHENCHFVESAATVWQFKCDINY